MDSLDYNSILTGMRKHPHLFALGKKIRRLRTSQGYSQEAFADEIGMDRSYYGGIERGERNVAAINLVRIALSLKVEVGELFPTLRTLKSKT